MEKISKKLVESKTKNELYELMEELYPICRSITGNGVRKTLKILKKKIPLKIIEVPTGTKVFDWTIPKEWNIDDAYIIDPNGEKIIDFKNKYEYALSRPTVIKDGLNDYKMWYSFRAQKEIDTYRIGYSESKDGINWIRKDEEAGIDVSNTGWDSEMICYPYVFDHKGRRYMFYNGNHYGKSGFGLAVLEED